MRNVLSARARPVLERIAGSRSLVALDYDGTLAPIVADPDRARMRTVTRRLLARVAARYPTAVVSGRRRGEVARFLAGVPLRAIVGNHGVEWGTRSGPPTAGRVLSWRRSLVLALAGLDGVGIEGKGLSLTIHYRAAPDRRAAAAAARAAAQRLPRVRIVPGKCVLNIVAADAPHKGDAVERLRRRLGCELAVFVGDDRTDEDAFSLTDGGSLVAIRVGRSRRSRAPWYLESQLEVDALLETLLALRRAAGKRRG